MATFDKWSYKPQVLPDKDRIVIRLYFYVWRGQSHFFKIIGRWKVF